MSKRHLTDDELQSYLDSDLLDNREWIEAHLQVCEHCREELASYQELCSELTREVGFGLPPEFAESVVSKILRPGATASRKGLLSLLASIFALAVGFAALGYFTDLKPLLGFAEHIGYETTSLIISISSSFSQLFSALNMNTHLLLYVAMVLVLTLILDQVLLHKKRPVFHIK
jgi:predicted anti-sigma-YlaC factor YlaD